MRLDLISYVFFEFDKYMFPEVLFETLVAPDEFTSEVAHS